VYRRRPVELAFFCERLDTRADTVSSTGSSILEPTSCLFCRRRPAFGWESGQQQAPFPLYDRNFRPAEVASRSRYIPWDWAGLSTQNRFITAASILLSLYLPVSQGGSGVAGLLLFFTLNTSSEAWSPPKMDGRVKQAVPMIELSGF